jgi:hypothetical protein
MSAFRSKADTGNRYEVGTVKAVPQRIRAVSVKRREGKYIEALLMGTAGQSNSRTRDRLFPRGATHDQQLYGNHQTGGAVVQAKTIVGRTQRIGLWPLRNWRRGLTASRHGSETDEGKALPGPKQRS